MQQVLRDTAPVRTLPSRDWVNPSVGGLACTNGDGTTTSDGQNSYDTRGNVVGCRNGVWGSPN